MIMNKVYFFSYDRNALSTNISRCIREANQIRENAQGRDLRAGEQKRINQLDTFRVACVRKLQDIKIGA